MIPWLPRNLTHIVGVDESGTGAWAGSFYVAAVCVGANDPLPPVRDSKTTKAPARHRMVQALEAAGVIHYEQEVPPHKIVEGAQEALWVDAAINAIDAAAFQKPRQTTGVVVDGKDCRPLRQYLLELGFPARNIVFLPKADSRVPAVSAASLFAKYRRDQDMDALDSQYPSYSFRKNAGYGTEEHIKAIIRFGVLPVHRQMVHARLRSQKWSHLQGADNGTYEED